VLVNLFPCLCRASSSSRVTTAGKARVSRALSSVSGGFMCPGVTAALPDQLHTSLSLQLNRHACTAPGAFCRPYFWTFPASGLACGLPRTAARALSGIALLTELSSDLAVGICCSTWAECAAVLTLYCFLPTPNAD
jgi:hypothetical protein